MLQSGARTFAKIVWQFEQLSRRFAPLGGTGTSPGLNHLLRNSKTPCFSSRYSSRSFRWRFSETSCGGYPGATRPMLLLEWSLRIFSPFPLTQKRRVGWPIGNRTRKNLSGNRRTTLRAVNRKIVSWPASPMPGGGERGKNTVDGMCSELTVTARRESVRLSIRFPAGTRLSSHPWPETHRSRRNRSIHSVLFGCGRAERGRVRREL